MREQAVQLRLLEELSYTEIRKRLGVSKSTLSYWLQELPLSKDRILELRRQGWQKGETSRERYRATMRERRLEKDQKAYNLYKKQFEILSRDSLFIAGLMLYMGEGAKKKDATISIANTDANIINFFILWLITFLNVERSEIRIQLHLYENMDIGQEEIFWQNKLGLKKSQFYKTSIRKLREASFSYKESFRHGTCSLYVFGAERRRNTMMAIKALVERIQKV